MKKFIKTFLIFLLLAPMLLLAACSDPSSYVITASPSDSLLGSVQGVSTEAMTEGTKITLVAKENTNTATSNPFICWIKDQTKVVSTEKSLELTYNATTAGNYTALFSETDPQKMMYVSIGDISLDSALNIQTINFNLQYAASTSSSDYRTIISSSFENGQSYISDYTNVLYLGNAASNNEYIIRLELTLTYTDGSTTSPFYVEFDSEVNRNAFDSDGNLVITQYDNITQTDVSISFSKIRTDLFTQD